MSEHAASLPTTLGKSSTGSLGAAVSDGIRAPLTGRMPSVCAYCGDTYGCKPCMPEMDGKETHGCCPACFPGVMAEVERELEIFCNERIQR
jgi:hypothetical protein